MKKILSIIAGKPNLIKAEPINMSCENLGFKHVLVDYCVANKKYGLNLYKDLGLDRPKYLFGSTLSSNYLELVKVLTSWTIKIIENEKPDYIVVYGDLDGGVAGALAAHRSSINLIHVESGLRNLNTEDTEELNRIFIDNISDILLPTSAHAMDALLNEKLGNRKIVRCGNTIIDCLRRHIKIANSKISTKSIAKGKDYILLTVHRDENLDSKSKLIQIIDAVNYISQKVQIVFILYKSTRKALDRFGMYDNLLSNSSIRLLETQSYHAFIDILQNCKMILTDSSSIVDEATFLQKRCIIIRKASHRLGALSTQVHNLVSANSNEIKMCFDSNSMSGNNKFRYPSDWDLDFISEFSKLIE